MYPEQLLFPHKFKIIGWLLFIPGLIGALLFIVFKWFPFELTATVYSIFNPDGENGFSMFIPNHDIRDEIIVMLMSIGGILVAYSAEKDENDLVKSIRLNSFKWSFFLGMVFIVITTPWIYEFSYLRIMMYNMYAPLIIYILKFNITLYYRKNQHKNESAKQNEVVQSRA